MDEAQGHDDDCCEECQAEEAEPTPKEAFSGLVQTILSLNEGAGAVYGRLEAAAAPFDRELVLKLQACRRADEELIAYCRRKAEAG